MSTQNTDIVLGGAGYMLVPGAHAYRKTQDGIAEGKTGRLQIQDFFGGQLRKYALERDRVFGGVRVGPASNGQAVTPWPYHTTASLDAGTPAPSADTHRAWAVVGNRVYYAMNNRVYQTVELTNNTWSAPVALKNFTNTITDLCYYAGNLLVAQGSAVDVQFLNVGDASNVALLSGEKANAILSYSGYALWSDARAGSPPDRLRLVKGTGVDSRYLDNQILRLALVDGAVYAMTRTSIFHFSGRVRDVLVPNPAYALPGDDAQIPGEEWSGEFEPFFQHGTYGEHDDFRMFVGFGGKVYANFAKRIFELTPDGDRAGWRDLGLNYYKCRGACVAGAYLIVTITTHDFRSQIWAWDGSGWWLIDDQDVANIEYHNPIPMLGAGNYDLLVMRHGSHVIDLFRLIQRSPATATSIPEGTASLVSPLLDAGERDKLKAWRKAGCVFADPQPWPLDSEDEINLFLDYSVDNGGTWITAASLLNHGGSSHNAYQVELTADIASAFAVSRWLQLRVRWEGLTRWAPVLTSCWAEYEVLENPARRRKWIMLVQADNQVVNRDGVPVAETGQQIINQLWADWQNDTSLTFRDLDYDAVPVERTVRITGIEEQTDRPSDQAAWGHATIKLTLVEV